MTLADQYKERYEVTLRPIALAIERQLQDYLSEEKHIDRISARAKSPERFLAKAENTAAGVKKYSDPLSQIQDQVGARIITFYLSDVKRISETIERHYRPIESRAVVQDSEPEFGYVGMHYVLIIQKDLIDSNIDPYLAPEFFDLQGKTLFQHAWSEANHDLGYKPGEKP